MKIYLDNNQFYYEIEKLAAQFFPNTKFEEIHNVPDELEAPYIYVGQDYDHGETLNHTVRVAVCIDDFYRSGFRDVDLDHEDAELYAANLLYDLLVDFTGVEMPWGVLTGVRPIKLYRKLKQEMNEEELRAHFRKMYRVSPEKLALASETERIESGILKQTEDRSFSLYIAIPFCPTRCSYCSFVTTPTKKTWELIEPYTELLCREIEQTAVIAKKYGLKLESIYMGGGTPTTLSAEQISKVLGTARFCFDISGLRELTVEAGRPDTITNEKLLAMKDAGVDRISINPQTLNDEVLDIIGRHHTSSDVIEAYKMARRHGFDHINMDIIAGLPGETFGSFRNTLDKIAAMNPESVTVHTLCMKRASDLTQAGKQLDKEEAQTAAEMVTYSNKLLHAAGYRPYYLYRQSRMVGNLENTGWAKPGKEGYYNVFIMEEEQSILSCGAGAVTKLCCPNGSVVRIFNYKYPYEYIDGFDKMLDRKKGIEDFYDQLG